MVLGVEIVLFPFLKDVVIEINFFIILFGIAMAIFICLTIKLFILQAEVKISIRI
jgi:hypothetical protein